MGAGILRRFRRGLGRHQRRLVLIGGAILHLPKRFDPSLARARYARRRGSG